MNKLLKGVLFAGVVYLGIKAVKKCKANAGASDYPLPNPTPTPMPIYRPPTAVKDTPIVPEGVVLSQYNGAVKYFQNQVTYPGQN